MKATYQNVIIEEIVEDFVSSGGVLMGNTRDVKFKKGKVIAFGDKVKNIEVGDTVHYDGYRASMINLKGKSYCVCDYEQIVIVE